MSLPFIRIPVVIAALLASTVHATGLATCDSGDESTWQPSDKLEQMLSDKGWDVRRIKVDGGCYEVYATDEKGVRVEAYFDPRDFSPVTTEKHD